MKSNAIFDKSGKYRYLLSRMWDSSLPKLLYIMLNPSIANATIEDRTSKQCLYFAKKLDFGSFEVVNLYSLISTNPKNLKVSTIDPIGNETDHYILEAASKADKIIAAWGCNHFFNNRNGEVAEMLKQRKYKLFCFEKTKYGHPRHPSRLKHDINELLDY